jgi:Abi-like protein
MEFPDFELNFSSQRMARYLAAANNDHEQAIHYYHLNFDICKAFYPLIGALEVTLRNRISEVLSEHFKDTDWIINQKHGFMAAPTNGRTRNAPAAHCFLAREIEKAEQKIRRRRLRPTCHSILSEQTFGFWVEMYTDHYYRRLLGKPIKAFGKLPREHGRREISQKLHLVRILRNRISHNEPIIFQGDRFDLAQVKQLRSTLLELAGWLNPQLFAWMSQLADIRFLDSQCEVAC